MGEAFDIMRGKDRGRMYNVLELDVLLSQTLDVAGNKENRNKINIISQLPLFLYLGDGKFIPQEILSQVFEKNR